MVPLLSAYDQAVMLSRGSLTKKACLFPLSASITYQNEGTSFGYMFSSYPKQLLFGSIPGQEEVRISGQNCGFNLSLALTRLWCRAELMEFAHEGECA